MSRNIDFLTQIQSELGGMGNVRATGNGVRSCLESAFPRNVGDTAVSEEMVRLVQRVFLSANGSAPRQVLFCGVDEDSGSSSVCARAGRALAEHSSRPVCLVDANLQSHRLSSLFGIDTTAQPGGVLTSPLEQCAQVGSNLWLARTAVLAGSGGVFPSLTELKERFVQLRAEFEYLLIDVAGANVRGDAAVLGQVTDAAILVVEANTTRRFAARKSKETLEAANVRLLGTVLHNRTFPIPEQLYRKL
jgi:Mrp family chromosome partitioning ATPase